MDCLLLTGELSGDLHGSLLLEKLLQKSPSLQVGAVAGPKMRSHPIETILPMEELQVMGFFDILSSLPKLWKIANFLEKTILEKNPPLVVSIDYPGLHLHLAKRLRKKGFTHPWFHYISPTIWAWKKGRIRSMEKHLDHLFSILPFEKPHFANSTLPVSYIGHPLVEHIPPTTAKRNEKLLAVFPGSRKKEIEKNLPLQLEVAKALQKRHPSLEIGISLAHPTYRPLVEALAPKIPLYADSSHLATTCQIAIATSGTITLELALHSTPTLVSFAISPLDTFLARKVFHIDLPFYCLVNLIGQKEIFPEFFGPNLHFSSLFLAAKHLWEDPSMQKKIEEECLLLRKLLTPEGSSPTSVAADALLKAINSSS